MADLPKMPYIDLLGAMKKVLSAHEAVQLGIATHAQKEADRKQQQYHKLEASKRLNQNTK
jgi:hypothetical protein